MPTTSSTRADAATADCGTGVAAAKAVEESAGKTRQTFRSSRTGIGYDYDPAPRRNFFVKEALRVVAALVGLLFVAVSINLVKIISDLAFAGRCVRGADRAWSWCCSLEPLPPVPGQSLPAIGAEVLITALVRLATVVHIHARRRAIPARRDMDDLAGRGHATRHASDGCGWREPARRARRRILLDRKWRGLPRSSPRWVDAGVLLVEIQR